MPLTPRNLVDAYECRHRVALVKTRSGGLLDVEDAAADEIVVGLGHEHEQLVKSAIEAVLGHTLSEPSGMSGPSPELVNSYQAGLLTPDGVLAGVPDFLLDSAGLGAIGAEMGEGSVLEPVDAKLARHSQPRALLQVAVYGEMLHRLGYPRPRRGHLVLGTNDGSPYRVESHPLAPLYPLVRSLLAEHASILPLSDSDVLWGDRVPACSLCPFSVHCSSGRSAAGDLSLLAGILPSQRRVLRDAGYGTVSELAAAVRGPAAMADEVFLRLRSQARLRSDELEGSGPRFEWASPAAGFPDGPRTLRYPLPRDEAGMRPPDGGRYLPAPDPADLFFDFEGYPHAPRGGLEYLFGWVVLEDGAPRFEYLWADTEEEERAALESFVDMLSARFQAHPDAHVYHYAPYETTALRRLAEKYGTRRGEVEHLIRTSRFVDLYSIVRGALLVGSGSYSIKRLEPLYMPSSRTGEVTTAGDSIRQYLDYTTALGRDEARSAQIRSDILEYNEYDCVSTLELLRWLDSNRAAALVGGPSVQELREEGEASEDSKARRQRVEELEELLSQPGDYAPAEAEWRRALSGLVGYYAREERLYWGDLFRKYDLADSQLAEDEDVAVVVGVGEVVPKPRSRTRSFVELHLQRPTRLSGSLKVHNGEVLKGVSVADPETLQEAAAAAGTSLSGSPSSLWVEVSESEVRSWTMRRTLLHSSNVPPGAKQEVVLALAEQAALGSVPASAAREVTIRSGMRTRGPRSTGGPTEAARAAVQGLEVHAYCAVQGPPGAGKTYLAVKVLEDALERGWSVGVCCVAHKAYENVLEGAEAAGVPTLVHASGSKAMKEGSRRLNVVSWANLQAAGGDPFVLGGTVFAYAGLAKAVLAGEATPIDLLVVDEASQMPLVDLIAVSPAAKRLLLLGDPRQLPHVSQATHPEGWDVSVLGHLVGEESVMPPAHGFFLDETRRFPPSLAAVVSSIAYDGRLAAHPETSTHHAAGRQGAYTLPVSHVGSSTSSSEEAEAIVGLVRELLGSKVKTRSGSGVLGEGDVIVVAPYNDQVRVVTEALASAGMGGVRVGTVDRFQGQEAAVAVYSVTTSSAEDAPRGPEFALDSARLNVALSRAQALAVVVGNPALASSLGSSVERLYAAGRACSVLLDLPRWEPFPADR